MAELKRAASSPAATDPYAISPGDREILRGVAGKVAALAGRPIEAEKRALWHAHNALIETRPVIFCDPENGWNEVLPRASMQCQGELARGWEYGLRAQTIWAEKIRDDRVIEPYFNVGFVHTNTGWGLKEQRIGGEHGGAYKWEGPLTSYDLIEKLHFPKITVDREASERLMESAQATLGDLLTVRRKQPWWWTLGLTMTAANLRGLEQLMLDMYDEPANLHRLMAFLRDGTMAMVDALERDGLLSANADGMYVGSGGFGYSRETHASGKSVGVHPDEMWGFCESQETVGVSPEMFGEFVLPYQLPLLKRFALNCYGCCEPLQTRWDEVKKIPRLRRVSVAPSADIEKMAEDLADRYVFSMKPQPADLATPVMDEGRVRGRLRRALEVTHGCRMELVMKDNHTLGGNPGNLFRWVEIAREEIARAYPGA